MATRTLIAYILIAVMVATFLVLVRKWRTKKRRRDKEHWL